LAYGPFQFLALPPRVTRSSRRCGGEPLSSA